MAPEWRVKIADFGFSKRVSQSISMPDSYRGTELYQAPEYRDLLNNCQTSNYTTMVDMWSFGCLIFELLTGRVPFENSDSLKNYQMKKIYLDEPLEKYGISYEGIELLGQLLEPEPERRLSAIEASSNTWMSAQNAVIPSLGSSELLNETMTPTSLPHVDSKLEEKTLPTESLIMEVSRTESAPELTEVLHRKDIDADNTAKPPPLPPRLSLRPKSSTGIRSTAAAKIETSSPAFVRGDSDTTPQGSPLPRTATSDQPFNEESVDPPQLPPRKQKAPARTCTSSDAFLTSMLLEEGPIDMHFGNLTLDAETKPECDVFRKRKLYTGGLEKLSKLFYCKECGHRPLCEACIFKTFENSSDPHEADHKLQEWIQGHIFSMETFLTKFSASLEIGSFNGLEDSYGSAWLASDHHFSLPVSGYLDTRWDLIAPPGEYSVSVKMRTAKIEDAICASAIGRRKSLMIQRGIKKLGSIDMGARTMPRVAVQGGRDGDVQRRPCLDTVIRHGVKLADSQEGVLTFGSKIEVVADQILEVHVRASYDPDFFTSGSPFQWFMEKIR
jgi:hypothetical protein